MKQRDQESYTKTEKEVILQFFSELLLYLIEIIIFRLADLISLTSNDYNISDSMIIMSIPPDSKTDF